MIAYAFLLASTIAPTEPTIPIVFETSMEGFQAWARTADLQVVQEDFEPKRYQARWAIPKPLKGYPPELVTEHLRQVHFVRFLSRGGEPLTGSHIPSAKAIVIAGGEPWRHDEVEVTRIVHRELASLLFLARRSEFPEREWLSTNPRGFRYPKGGSRGADEDEALFDRGVMPTENAEIAAEIGEMASRLMQPTPAFASLLERNDRLKRKAALVARFYDRLRVKLPSLPPARESAALPDGLSLRFASEGSVLGAEIQDWEVRDHARTVVAQEATRYPPAILRDNLREVSVLRELREGDLSFGGLAMIPERRVVLTATEAWGGLVEEESLRVNFHHELAHILYDRHFKRFPMEEWVKANGGAVYLGIGGREAMRQGRAGKEYRIDLHEKGFLNEYSMVELEEDVAEYAGGLFAGGEKFWGAYERFPKVRQKADLVARFYQNLDASITIEKLRGGPRRQ